MRRTKLPQSQIQTSKKQKPQPRPFLSVSKKQSKVKQIKLSPKEMKELAAKSKDANGKFLPGNKLWKYANPFRPTKYTPEALWKKACEYFDWMNQSPFYEEKSIVVNKDIETVNLPKMRPYTLDTFQVFAKISDDTYRNYRNKPAFLGVCSTIDKIIKGNKFEGACAGFFNHAIIARDLGLADKKDLTSSDGTMSPVNSDEKAKQNRELLMAQLSDKE